MPLFETLVAAVGPAIAKTVLKLWARDNKVASEGGGSAIEALTKLIRKSVLETKLSGNSKRSEKELLKASCSYSRPRASS